MNDLLFYQIENTDSDALKPLFRQSFLSFFPDVSFSSVLFTALVSSEIFYFPPTVLKGLILDRLSEKDAAAAGEDAVSGGAGGGAGGGKGVSGRSRELSFSFHRLKTQHRKLLLTDVCVCV